MAIHLIINLGVCIIESNYENSPEKKLRTQHDETDVSLRRMGRFISRPRFSEENQKKLEEISHDEFIDQVHAAAPDEVTIPSRLLKNK